jgi:hypothetical protein
VRVAVPRCVVIMVIVRVTVFVVVVVMMWVFVVVGGGVVVVLPGWVLVFVFEVAVVVCGCVGRRPSWHQSTVAQPGFLP